MVDDPAGKGDMYMISLCRWRGRVLVLMCWLLEQDGAGTPALAAHDRLRPRQQGSSHRADEDRKMKRILLLLASLMFFATPAAAQTAAPACRFVYEVGSFDSPTVKFSPDGEAFLVTDYIGKTTSIGAYDTKTGLSLGLPGGYAWFHGNRWISVTSADGKDQRLYDRKTGAEQPLPPGITGIGVSGRHAVLSGDSRGARMVRADDLAIVVQFQGLATAAVNDDLGLAVACQPDSSPKGGKS